MKPKRDNRSTVKEGRKNSVESLFSLRGQVALVTGGSKGLGFEIATVLAVAGATVVLLARNERVCQQAAARIVRTTGATCAAISADVSREESIKEAISSVEQSHGRIDVLVNSAGINQRGLIEELSPEDFSRVQQVNVTGTWLLCRAVVPGMKQRGYGRIINLGSALSVRGLPGRTAYASSKGAVLNLTRCLAVELGGSGITVNALLPGFFATELNVALLKKPGVARKLTQRVPQGRWGKLHEIRAAALFLASSGASYVTGSAVAVDGGWTAS
jgi:NAD(P)-dependent dehydrogenase (short-subunit alcohol dehydrogenase family)